MRLVLQAFFRVLHLGLGRYLGLSVHQLLTDFYVDAEHPVNANHSFVMRTNEAMHEGFSRLSEIACFLKR